MIIYWIARTFAVWMIALTGLLDSFAFAQNASPSTYPSVRTNLIAFPVTTLDGKTITATGKLQVPRNLKGRAPAVLILHGSAGLDSRGQMHALDLNRGDARA